MDYYLFVLNLYYTEAMEGFETEHIYLTWDPSAKEKQILFLHLLESFKNPLLRHEISEFKLEGGKVVSSFKEDPSQKIIMSWDCRGPIALERRNKSILKEIPNLEKLLTSGSSLIREEAKKLLQ